MGIAQDLGLIDTNGNLDSIFCHADTSQFPNNCEDLHSRHTKASTAYLHGQVNLIQNRLYVSVEDKTLGTVDPDDDKLLAALALNSPTDCMIELFKGQQGFGCRLHFNRNIL